MMIGNSVKRTIVFMIASLISAMELVVGASSTSAFAAADARSRNAPAKGTKDGIIGGDGLNAGFRFHEMKCAACGFNQRWTSRPFGGERNHAGARARPLTGL